MSKLFGLPECAYAAALSTLPTLTPKKLRGVLMRDDPEEAWFNESQRAGVRHSVVDDMWARCEEHDVRVVSIRETLYPRILRFDPSPPAVLFYRGSLDVLGQRRVGIVGTRSPTPSGVYTAREFGEQLAHAGVAVVSGLARGIDGAAHQGMKFAHEEQGMKFAHDEQSSDLGRPIGVVACGLDVVYPKSNAALWEWVGTAGLLLSEYAPGTQAEPYHFPQRNRIIAALSEVVVVVESREKGGSMLTVAEALRRDIEVFAVPGSPRVPSAGGTNLLIQQGCGTVTSTDDLLAALSLDHRRSVESRSELRTLPDAHDAYVLEQCRDGAVTIDQLLIATGRSITDIAVSLGRLEALGWVVDSSGWWEAVVSSR